MAQAHGLNANLVRKWLVGRGLKRCGLDHQGAATPRTPAAAPIAASVPAIPFVPVQLPPPSPPDTAERGQAIEIELTRAGASLSVRWPAAQAAACASWLGELAQVLSR